MSIPLKTTKEERAKLARDIGGMRFACCLDSPNLHEGKCFVGTIERALEDLETLEAEVAKLPEEQLTQAQEVGFREGFREAANRASWRAYHMVERIVGPLGKYSGEEVARTLGREISEMHVAHIPTPKTFDEQTKMLRDEIVEAALREAELREVERSLQTEEQVGTLARTKHDNAILIATNAFKTFKLAVKTLREHLAHGADAVPTTVPK